MLDNNILNQVSELFVNLDSNYTFKITYSPSREEKDEMIAFLQDVASCSSHITCHINEVSNGNVLEFSILKDNKPTGIKFRGIPNGHEFTSLLLALLNADDKGKNLPDEIISNRIKTISGEIKIQSYVSLTCTNCPDVVQALNIIALINPHITHEIIDGALFQDEVNKLKIQAVPTVFANGKLLHVGRGSLSELLSKLEDAFGTIEKSSNLNIQHNFDLLVVGGGPAGASSAIYSARKGLKVAVIAETIGGQVKETVGIENLISTPFTTGSELAVSLRKHMEQYNIGIYENRKIILSHLKNKIKNLTTDTGETFSAPAVIIATGAGWRKLGIDGENEYIGRGVAFCPHCDGPIFKNKNIAVIGGGNSGIEAAIDLAGICKSVIVFEYADSLKADMVLQKKLQSIPNISVHTYSQTEKILGDGEKVISINVKNRKTENMQNYPIDGIFVQIGLSANSSPFCDELETTKTGEIIIDSFGRTSIPGVYAAGDVSNIPYKQIIIAMGEGAKAALTAFDDRIRN